MPQRPYFFSVATIRRASPARLSSLMPVTSPPPSGIRAGEPLSWPAANLEGSNDEAETCLRRLRVSLVAARQGPGPDCHAGVRRCGHRTVRGTLPSLAIESSCLIREVGKTTGPQAG